MSTTIHFPCKGHTLHMPGDDLSEQLYEYYRHLTGDYDNRIDIAPMPTPRPRAVARQMGFKSGGQPKFVANVYNPSSYTQYKKDIVTALKVQCPKLKPGAYSKIFATIYIAYNKTEPKKNQIDGAPHIKKPDWDNFIKGLQDALEQSGILVADGGISEGAVTKKYTTEPLGFMKFNLK